jgi:sugar phosphate isomerase/epimerase
MEFFGIPENLLELIRRVKSVSDARDHLCVCVDTGHTNLAVNLGHPPVGDVIRQLGTLVEVLHLHDNNGIKDQHKIPMTGIIDWNDVICALFEIGYKGYYNLEVVLTHFGKELMEEEATFAVKVINNLLKTNKEDAE